MMSEAEKRQELMELGSKLMQLDSTLGMVPDNYDFVRGILIAKREGLARRQAQLRKEVFG